MTDPCPTCSKMKELLLGCLDYMQKCGTPCPPNTCEVCDQYDRVNKFLMAEEASPPAREDVCHTVQEFYDAVCKEAESNMLKTGKLEGAHFAAMRKLLPAFTSPDARDGKEG